MIEKYVNEEELRRLLSTLIIILGLIMIAALFSSIIVPSLRNANKPGAQTPVSPVVGEPGWLDPTEFPPQAGREIPAVDPQSLLNASPELVARGKELFEKNCTQCHGGQGKGDGVAAATMNPRPRNFTSPEGWVNGHDLPSIYKTLTYGIAGSSMASFDYLSKKNRMALAHAVQSFATFPPSTGDPRAVEALSQELSAPGERTPNKIPVSMAMSKLQEEFEAPQPLVINNDDASEGARVLREVVVDPVRAAQSLATNPLWRQSEDRLAESILNDAPANGFSAKAATMSPTDWKILMDELIRRMGP
jgi:mono/diheme cytochrome c family protein